MILDYVHCDVFSPSPYSGNSLAVFPDRGDLTASQMLAITQELRHFESIFLRQDGDQISARVFDLFEELPFAGHPIIGAAAMLHRRSGAGETKVWSFNLINGRTVDVAASVERGVCRGRLDQGRPDFLATVANDQRQYFAEAFNLKPDQLTRLPLEVISTGLKYLVIPVKDGLAEARIVRPDLEEKLAAIGAEFAYLFDVGGLEGRHWNNDGVMEDVATGSAAGVVGAFALKHGLAKDGAVFRLKQGRFLGRPSEIEVTAYGAPDNVSRVEVAGAVAFVGEGKVAAP